METCALPVVPVFGTGAHETVGKRAALPMRPTTTVFSVLVITLQEENKLKLLSLPCSSVHPRQ